MQKLDTFQLKVNYNPEVLEVVGPEGGEGVTDGKIGNTTVPVSMWAFSPKGVPGTLFILGNVPGVTGVLGSGFLAHIHFKVVEGSSGTTYITFSDGHLWDNGNPPSEIDVEEWIGDNVFIMSAQIITMEISTPIEVQQGEEFAADVVITESK